MLIEKLEEEKRIQEELEKKRLTEEEAKRRLEEEKLRAEEEKRRQEEEKRISEEWVSECACLKGVVVHRGEGQHPPREQGSECQSQEEGLGCNRILFVLFETV